MGRPGTRTLAAAPRRSHLLDGLRALLALPDGPGALLALPDGPGALLALPDGPGALLALPDGPGALLALGPVCVRVLACLAHISPLPTFIWPRQSAQPGYWQKGFCFEIAAPAPWLPLGAPGLQVR